VSRASWVGTVQAYSALALRNYGTSRHGPVLSAQSQSRRYSRRGPPRVLDPRPTTRRSLVLVGVIDARP
jgi:hypothetical protein